VFAISFGEYSIARVITGTSFETVPVWQVQLTPVNGGGNPNGVAVMSVLTFVLFFAVSLFAALSRDKAGGGRTAPQTLPGATTTASTQGGR
jgi:putative spermidine/putrescine transport system permease protein